jgi:hypothetical protein
MTETEFLGETLWWAGLIRGVQLGNHAMALDMMNQWKVPVELWAEARASIIDEAIGESTAIKMRLPGWPAHRLGFNKVLMGVWMAPYGWGTPEPKWDEWRVTYRPCKGD